MPCKFHEPGAVSMKNGLYMKKIATCTLYTKLAASTISTAEGCQSPNLMMTQPLRM